MRDEWQRDQEALALVEQLQAAVDEHGRILAQQRLLIQTLREELREIKDDGRPPR